MGPLRFVGSGAVVVELFVELFVELELLSFSGRSFLPWAEKKNRRPEISRVRVRVVRESDSGVSIYGVRIGSLLGRSFLLS